MHMDLSSAIDWWDEWKLRILVLCSLFVHFFLYFANFVCRWYVLRWLRVIVWVAYIGADALAIYALATLFNRQKQQQTTVGGGGGSSNTALEVVWAPVLLIHLGGRGISAYSLEDNELWKRHVITVVSQVTVALYVFCKWWSGEKRLLQAAVLLFIAGFLRSGQKPWALRRASYGRMISTSLSSMPPRSPANNVPEPHSSSRWRRLGKWCTAAVCTCTDFRDIRDETAQSREKPAGEGVGEEGTNYSLQLEDYVKEAQEHVKGGHDKLTQAGRAMVKDVYRMLLDLSAPYSIRLHYLQIFLNLDGGQNQHQLLREWITAQFVTIYTKARSSFTCLGVCTAYLVFPSLALASAVLFAKSDKDGYDKRDIKVTYILFFGTVVDELAPLFYAFLTASSRRDILLSQLLWQDMVAQHNVVSYCARKKKPPTLMKLATFSDHLRDLINKHWYIRHECQAQQISVLVRRHVEYGWKEYIRDAATYRRFNNLRGENTLMQMNPHLLEQDKLGWTFNMPFDEYVLLWHLATDLCIHQPTDDGASTSSQVSISSRHWRSSEIISNYMIYLLFICPEMLIPGARQDLFILACDDIERMIKDQPLQSRDKRSIAQVVFRCMEKEGGHEHMRESTMVSNAYRLAKLLDVKNNTEMWEVIQGVWVEMLCYSASRCRGYLHAKSLADGAEFLTNVWVLWWCMGMQTLPDMMNILGPPEEQPAVTSPVACV